MGDSVQVPIEDLKREQDYHFVLDGILSIPEQEKNNPISYEVLDYPIRESDYFGKVISFIPKVGLMTIPPYNYIIAGIAAGLVSVTGILGYKVIYQKNNSINKDKK